MSTWLIDTALYTGILIALVLVLRRPVAKAFGPTMAYALWALPLLRFVLPPLVLPASLAPAAETAPPALDPATMAMLLAAEEMNAAVPAAAGPTQLASPFEWSDLVLPLWLGTAALFLAWRMRNYFRMRRALLAEARPVGEAGKVRLVETPAVASPLAFGVIDKVVALPVRFMAMEDRHARDLAIAHELAHHAGHDIAANFAAQPLLALHWFNPLAWIGWRAMRRDQEAACDARVMAGRDRAERIAYANVIAGFAAGPRLALAAPMACPILGEKSIIHRLRSLSMTDITPRRRLTGRLLIGAAAVALPLTASVSYAQADAPSVAPVELPPSAPAAPQAPEAPEAPEAPVEREVHVYEFVHEDENGEHVAHEDGDRQVRTYRYRRNGDAPAPRGERQAFGFSTAHPLTEEQLRELREMGKRFEGEDWEEFAERQEEWAERFAERQEDWAERFAGQQAEMAERMARLQRQAPIVAQDCDEAGPGTRSVTDENGRKRVVICQRAIQARALSSAATGLRQARAAIAGNRAIDAEVRNEILGDLDEEIRRIERGED